MLLDDSGRHDGQAFEVTGPEAITLAEAAAVLTEVTGVQARYRDRTVEEASATHRPSGHPALTVAEHLRRHPGDRAHLLG